MAGTRALLASIGASVALVAASALSLLAVSVVFAFGWTAVSVPESVGTKPLVLAGTTASQPSSAGTHARIAAGHLVVAPPARRPKRSFTARRGGAGPSAVGAPKRLATSRPSGAPRSTPPLSPPPTHSIAVPKSPPPVSKTTSALGAKVKDTGTAIAEVTQPLAPPVSTVVQQVFNAVAELVDRTTSGLAAAVNKLLPPKK